MERLRRPVLLAALVLGGCIPVAKGLKPAPRSEAPAPYRVQVGDVLGLRLYMAPELDEDITVRPDGRITTTLAQSIPAAGRLPDEVAADLRRLYALELKNPQLALEVKQAAPARVFVGGEVVAPGEFESSGAPLTMVQAVSKAGGLRTTGDDAHVFILHQHVQQFVPVSWGFSYNVNPLLNSFNK